VAPHGRAAPVVVESPWRGAAMGEGLEFMTHGMISPDPGAQFLSLIVGGGGAADAGVIEDALDSVKPAVGAPVEAVEAFVGVLVTEAVEEHLWRAVGDVITILVGEEQQFRGGTDPHAAKADPQPPHKV